MNIFPNIFFSLSKQCNLSKLCYLVSFEVDKNQPSADNALQELP